MAGRFEGKVAILTGAAGGIGQAIARRFAADGAMLVLADINGEAVEKLAQELRTDGARATAVQVDVGVQQDNEEMVAAAIAEHGRLDILINNAAIGAFGRITDVAPEEWRRIFAVGVDSIFYASRSAMPHLATVRGCIVNTGSISGLYGDYSLAAYNAVKGAAANLTRAMALDHAEDGVRVNAVAPGSVRTPNSRIFDEHEGIREDFARSIPLGRRAETEEVADAIAFLASDEASYITGTHLVVDGGLTAASGQPNFRRAFGKKDGQ
ncbi:3-oxoacyl-ACP reductase [Sphingomonas sp. Root710]|uniref:SDR family NAD(P)-dependent oxidoreductase n=1 Tax=Sphingomonas sp. Root710 TaxID=1736594 RepID=UPI0006F5FDE5|nr:SDR family oxidoreductase [Sphingomonas sp. Root710]KRB83146.1 3-oxoacyl-ACP reductase [Sphingomonas sp. Root710]